MIYEFNVKTTRMMEEEISVIMDAEDQEEAEDKVRELVENLPSTDVRARRYHVLRRHYSPTDAMNIELVEYEEPEPPKYA